MVFAYFYVAYNEGLFKGMSVCFMEAACNGLFLILLALLIPIVVFYENKKKKQLVKSLLVFIPVFSALMFVTWSIPYKAPVRIVNYEDESKYILVDDLTVAKEAVELANDDNVRNKGKIDSLVEDLLKIEEK